MQTFLPYQSFTKSLQCLDDKRLGKQRVEAMQILNALEPGSVSRWRNHPAVKMWRGYEYALTFYHDFAIDIWQSRGFNNNMKFKHSNNLEYIYAFHHELRDHIKPPWLTEAFCSAHRSNLLFKGKVDGLVKAISSIHGPYKSWRSTFNLPKEKNQISYKQMQWLDNYCMIRDIKFTNHYSQFNWTEPDDLPYIWPV